MSDTKFERNAGILMPVSSLPSPYGIGTFGKDAYDFVTFVKECNHKYWQVLPLGPTTYGDSPYQSYSAFAGERQIFRDGRRIPKKPDRKKISRR